MGVFKVTETWVWRFLGCYTSDYLDFLLWLPYVKATGATAEFSWPLEKIINSPIKLIWTLVHPFRNVLFGVGIFVGFWAGFFGWFLYFFLQFKTENH